LLARDAKKKKTAAKLASDKKENTKLEIRKNNLELKKAIKELEDAGFD